MRRRGVGERLRSWREKKATISRTSGGRFMFVLAKGLSVGKTVDYIVSGRKER